MMKYMLKRSQITEALDQTFECLEHGETVDECLAHHPNLSDELSSLVEMRSQLKALPPVQRLPAEIISAHKQQFLAAASQYRRQGKHITWLQRLSSRTLSQTLRPPLKAWPALARVTLAVVFAFCIAAGLYSTAQASTPDTPLYGLKMAIEDARLSLTTDPAQHASLALTFAAERVREMMQTSSQGQAVPESVLTRFQIQLRVALQDATNADEPNRQRILAEINDVTKQLQNTLMQAEPEAPSAAQSALRQAEHLAEQTCLQTEEGLNDSAPYQKGPSITPVVPAPTFTVQPQPSATLRPAATTTRLIPSASGTPTTDATIEPTQTPYRNKAGSDNVATHTPAPQVTAPSSSAPATPHQTGQPASTPQPAAQPTNAPSHQPEPGPAQEGSPKRTTSNLQLMTNS